MNFKEINIEDKKIMDKYLKNSKYGNSEYSFSNLFIWKHIYNVKYSIYKDALILASFINEKSPKFLMPIAFNNLQEIINDIMTYCNQNNFTFKMIALSDEIIQDLKEFMPVNFKIIEKDIYDYIYLSEDLIELKGKKFSSKRNHIKKFDKNYEYEYIGLNSQNVSLCFDMLVKWCRNSDCEEESLKSELQAVKTALNNITELELTGGGLLVNNELIAFTLGQPINSETFNINIEKAFYEYEGAYTKINNEFAIRNLGSYKYINREEDLGIPGLRKAKQSYHPIKYHYKNEGILC